MPYYLYILRCSDNTYYTGSTNNLTKRLRAHNYLSSGAKYTRSRRPVQIVYSEEFPDLTSAKKREWEIKQLTREEKRQLVKKMSTVSEE